MPSVQVGIAGRVIRYRDQLIRSFMVHLKALGSFRPDMPAGTRTPAMVPVPVVELNLPAKSPISGTNRGGHWSVYGVSLEQVNR